MRKDKKIFYSKEIWNTALEHESSAREAKAKEQAISYPPRKP